MPYFVTDQSAGCSGWAVVKDDGEQMGCHTTKQAAISQMIAVSLAEGVEPGGERDIRQVNLEPPAYMRAAARRGLELNRQGHGGDGLTDKTLREARDMAAGRVSADKWVRIAAWIARHIESLDAPQNSDPDDSGYPGPGLVAHLLWGSGSTRRAANRTKAYAEGVVARLRAEEDRNMTIQERALPANYRPALSADVPEGRACGNCFFYDETRVDTTGTKAWCERWDDFVRGDHYCNSWRMDEAARTLMKGTKMTQAVERRVADFSDIEMRAADEGGPKMTFRGYAAVFNSPSEPLPFTEVIAPGAFKRSLKARNEIKMFVNHNMDRVLASTRAGTLTLAEDERGLVVEAQLPDTTDGRDLSVLLERGDVSSMSFGFTVPKGGDKWNSEGSERTLKQVRLHEVSVVTGFPAYEATTASVRTLDFLATRTNVDAEAIADVLTKLEAGETLPNDEADLLVEVVTKLRDNSPQVEQDFNALDLKRKELDLLFKAV